MDTLGVQHDKGATAAKMKWSVLDEHQHCWLLITTKNTLPVTPCSGFKDCKKVMGHRFQSSSKAPKDTEGGIGGKQRSPVKTWAPARDWHGYRADLLLARPVPAAVQANMEMCYSRLCGVECQFGESLSEGCLLIDSLQRSICFISIYLSAFYLYNIYIYILERGGG